MKYHGAKAESHYDNSHVYLMDCMDALRQTPDKYFDLAVVDPPYGLPKDSTHGRGKLKNRILNNGGLKVWDVAPNSEYFSELFRVSKDQIIWGGNYFGLPGGRGFAIWDKDQPFENFSACEFAWISFDKPAKIFREATTRTGESKIHPTQKSVKLYDWIYHNYLPNGGKVIDTHLGSGSNRIAADKARNIEFYGFEIDSEYYEAQEKRFKIYKAQLRMF